MDSVRRRDIVNATRVSGGARDVIGVDLNAAVETASSATRDLPRSKAKSLTALPATRYDAFGPWRIAQLPLTSRFLALNPLKFFQEA